MLAGVVALRSESRPELWAYVANLDLGFDVHPESRRRATQSLTRKGLVETRLALTPGPPRRGDPFRRHHLYARVPLTADEQEDADALYQEYLDHLYAQWRGPAREIERNDLWMQWYWQTLIDGRPAVFIEPGKYGQVMR